MKRKRFYGLNRDAITPGVEGLTRGQWAQAYEGSRIQAPTETEHGVAVVPLHGVTAYQARFVDGVYQPTNVDDVWPVTMADGRVTVASREGVYPRGVLEAEAMRRLYDVRYG